MLNGRRWSRVLWFVFELEATEYCLGLTGQSLIEWMEPVVLVILKASSTIPALFHHDGGKLLNNFPVDRIVG